MKSGFKVDWTEHSLLELKQTIDYLELDWTEKELVNFSRELDHTVSIISRDPNIFQKSNG